MDLPSAPPFDENIEGNSLLAQQQKLDVKLPPPMNPELLQNETSQGLTTPMQNTSLFNTSFVGPTLSASSFESTNNWQQTSASSSRSEMNESNMDIPSTQTCFTAPPPFEQPILRNPQFSPSFSNSMLSPSQPLSSTTDNNLTDPDTCLVAPPLFSQPVRRNDTNTNSPSSSSTELFPPSFVSSPQLLRTTYSSNNNNNTVNQWNFHQNLTQIINADHAKGFAGSPSFHNVFGFSVGEREPPLRAELV
jgi:hypothetical protein